MAPFVLSVDTDQLKRNHFKDIIPCDEGRLPMTPQILTNDAATFLKTALYIRDNGYSKINWNLGCPFPMVANKKRGSGLLPFPSTVDSILGSVCPSLNMALSVKLRLGRYDPSELIDLMPVLNSYPLAEIIIHPRIGTQMYTGEVNLDGFERAVAMCRHPVVYNGDIKNISTYLKLRTRFPFVNEWMIGRWAIAFPFLASRIKAAAPDQTASPQGEPMLTDAEVAKIRLFHDELFDAYQNALCGPAHLMDKMKEIWTYLGSSFPGRQTAVLDIRRSKTLDSYHDAVHQVFGD